MFPPICGRLETVCFVQMRSILKLVSIIMRRGVAVVKMCKHDTVDCFYLDYGRLWVRKKLLALKISYGTQGCNATMNQDQKDQKQP